jgi:hypothetical protein
MDDPFLNVLRSQPHRLARMLDLRAGKDGNWSADEMEAILRHQLDTPLDVDLPQYRSSLVASQSLRSERRTFGQLLHERWPPLRLLQGIMRFAEAHLRQPSGGLPQEIARVLYYGSVLAARLRWDTRITRLSDAQLRSALTWAIDQPWLDSQLRKLFCSGRALLGEG